MSNCYDKSNYHDSDRKQEIALKSQKTFADAIALRDEVIWKELSSISVRQAAEYFLATLSGNTKRSYKAAIHSIFDLFRMNGLLDQNENLQTFALSNLDYLLDEIKAKISGEESTKQARAAAFISFTRYLQRATGGLIQKVSPRKDKGNPTFRQIREISLTQALTKAEWSCFLLSLKQLSHRDYLIAKTVIQGAKRIGEVLTAQIDQIHWEKNQITFRQFKSKIIEKKTIITYPESFMRELKEYIGDRTSGPLFITRTGTPLSQPHLYRSFARAGKFAGLSFKVHPHMLRASAITFLSSCGYHADQIMRVSGHADEKLIRYYDKTPLERNPTQEVCLI